MSINLLDLIIPGVFTVILGLMTLYTALRSQGIDKIRIELEEDRVEMDKDRLAFEKKTGLLESYDRLSTTQRLTQDQLQARIDKLEQYNDRQTVRIQALETSLTRTKDINTRAIQTLLTKSKAEILQLKQFCKAEIISFLEQTLLIVREGVEVETKLGALRQLVFVRLDDLEAPDPITTKVKLPTAQEILDSASHSKNNTSRPVRTTDSAMDTYSYEEI